MQGETLRETQKSMMDAIALYFEDNVCEVHIQLINSIKPRIATNLAIHNYSHFS